MGKGSPHVTSFSVLRNEICVLFLLTLACPTGHSFWSHLAHAYVWNSGLARSRDAPGMAIGAEEALGDDAAALKLRCRVYMLNTSAWLGGNTAPRPRNSRPKPAAAAPGNALRWAGADSATMPCGGSGGGSTTSSTGRTCTSRFHEAQCVPDLS